MRLPVLVLIALVSLTTGAKADIGQYTDYLFMPNSKPMIKATLLKTPYGVSRIKQAGNMKTYRLTSKSADLDDTVTIRFTKRSTQLMRFKSGSVMINKPDAPLKRAPGNFINDLG